MSAAAPETVNQVAIEFVLGAQAPVVDYSARLASSTSRTAI
jgi:hypothetical protein